MATATRGNKARRAKAQPPAAIKKGVSYGDLKPDSRNANMGTERGLGMLEHSLRTYGAGRSILVDKNGVVIAGNKTLDRAAELGLQLRVVETDGKELVVVRRADLDINTPEGRSLAVADNRVAEIDLQWNAEEMARLMGDGVPLDQFFFPDELEKLLAQPIQLEGEAGAVAPAPADMTVQPLQSPVRMVQLFLSTTTFSEFSAAVIRLADVYGTKNPTETVLACLREKVATLES